MTKNKFDNYYFEEISRIPLLTAEEEKKIAALAFKGDKEAQLKLVQANLRFVAKIANSYKNRGVDYEDLISEGNEGLMIAAGKFNPEKNTRFITYAVWWIRLSLNKAVYEKGKSVRIPVGNSSALMDSRWNMLSLDKEIDETDSSGACFGDTIPDNKNVTFEKIENQIAAEQLIAKGFKYLNEIERTVLIHRFGLYNVNGKSLSQIGELTGFSKERIRQIESKAISKIRNSFVELGIKSIAA